MSAAEDLHLAEARVVEARSRLTGTVGDIQRRLHPLLLFKNAWNGVRETSVSLADDAVETAMARPGAAAGIAAAIAALALRRPLGRLLRRTFSRKRETKPPEDRL